LFGRALLDYRNVLDVTGSTAVITGGARGLGFEAATALAQCGACVILADLDAKALSAAVGRLKVSGATASSVVLDVTDAQAVENAADELVKAHGKVDILINSAGIARLNSKVETRDAEWRQVMDVNVNGVFWCCRAFGRHMLERRDGRIVNLGSMSG
jgi:galactitol 2-dehydrogenase (L-tagatose-forming)